MSERPVWDYMANCERPAPSKAEIDAVELDVTRQLASLGAIQGIGVALDAISALLYAEDFKVGSRGFTKYMALIIKFITQRVRQYERNDELIPNDIRNARM